MIDWNEKRPRVDAVFSRLWERGMHCRHGFGFAVFCLLAGSRWLVDAAWPETLPPSMAQIVDYGVVGLVALMGVVLFRQWAGWNSLRMLRIGAAGFVLLGAPAILGQFAGGVTPQTSVALYALVPLCVTVGATVQDGGNGRGSMMPAFAGLTGVLLLLPWQLPSTAAGAVSFGLMVCGVLLTAVACLWLHALLAGSNLPQSLAVIGLINAAVLGTMGLVHGDSVSGLSWTVVGPELLRALLIEMPLLFLLLWLLREMVPERLAARFFIVPSVTVLEGWVMLRGPVNPRMIVSILLLLLGAGSLLFGKREESVRLDLR